MKTIIAILLSVLMLCSVIPFAATSVSAAVEYVEHGEAILVEADAEEVDAGDEVTITVSLVGNPGVIGAQVEVGFDAAAFELVTYYDEDEEMWIPPIEVGSKYNASSNKYILFSPINEETGEMKRCLVQYLRATLQTPVTNEEFFVATFKVKDDAPSGTYSFYVKDHNVKNIITLNNDWVVFDEYIAAEVTVNGNEPTPPACEHEYFTPCEQYCMICGELTNPEASHNIVHVEAKDATCTELGNIEYWYCDVCGMAWLNESCTKNTNLMAVKLPMADHVYDDDYDADCNTCGDKRVVVYPIFTFGGNSVSKDVHGLAFRFLVNDMYTDLNWKADSNLYIDYNNCTVTPDSSATYKLVSMGAVVSNNGSETYLENVDGHNVMDVVAEKVVNEGYDDVPFYAIRVLNIPEAHFDTEIAARPYFIYECDGEQVVVYGEQQTATYNNPLM